MGLNERSGRSKVKQFWLTKRGDLSGGPDAGRQGDVDWLCRNKEAM